MEEKSNHEQAVENLFKTLPLKNRTFNLSRDNNGYIQIRIQLIDYQNLLHNSFQKFKIYLNLKYTNTQIITLHWNKTILIAPLKH
jgi:hypothetical protein